MGGDFNREWTLINAKFFCPQITQISLIFFATEIHREHTEGNRRSATHSLPLKTGQQCSKYISVFFSVSHQLPYSKKNIIEDLLEATLFQLGPKYRINIMELVATDGHAYFKITYGRGYRDTSKYKKKITMRIPGASDAWEHGGPIYLPQKDLRSDIDHDVKHLWSTSIKGRRGQSVAVLNIDNIVDDEIRQEDIGHLKTASLQLTELIGYYWEIPS